MSNLTCLKAMIPIDEFRLFLEETLLTQYRPVDPDSLCEHGNEDRNECPQCVWDDYDAEAAEDPRIVNEDGYYDYGDYDYGYGLSRYDPEEYKDKFLPGWWSNPEYCNYGDRPVADCPSCVEAAWSEHYGIRHPADDTDHIEFDYEEYFLTRYTVAVEPNFNFDYTEYEARSSDRMRRGLRHQFGDIAENRRRRRLLGGLSNLLYSSYSAQPPHKVRYLPRERPDVRPEI